MNSLKTFFQKLLPSFDRSRVIEDIDSMATNIESNLAPNYKAAAQLLRNKQPASKWGRVVEVAFHYRNKNNRGQNYVGYFNEVLPRIAETLKMLERLVPEIFARDVTKESLTYKRAAVLQFLGLTRFVLDYAGVNLRVLLADEAAFALNGAEAAEDVAKADRAYLSDNLETFMHALSIVGQQTVTIAENLGTMQDLQLIVDKINVIAQTAGPENVDPLRMNFLGWQATSSPVYILMSAWAGYQDKNHKRQIEESKALQLRLMALKEAYAQKQSPAMQSRIQYTEDRLQRVMGELDEYRASIA